MKTANQPGQPKVRPIFIVLLLIVISPFVFFASISIQTEMRIRTDKSFVNDQYMKSVKFPTGISPTTQKYMPGDITNANKWIYEYTTNLPQAQTYAAVHESLRANGYSINEDAARVPEYILANNHKIYVIIGIGPNDVRVEATRF